MTKEKINPCLQGSMVVILCFGLALCALVAFGCEKSNDSLIDGISTNTDTSVFTQDPIIFTDTSCKCEFENLHQQPLEIIQECLQGKWKVLMVSKWGFLGILCPTNTFINIDTKNNNVVITENENEQLMIMNGFLNKSFYYNWELKEVYQWGIGLRPPCYTTYVMQNNDQDIEGWYFDKIINDTLRVVVDYHPDKSDCESYLFLRIRDNNLLKLK